MNSSWVLLSYKIPPEPVKARVAIWRKIKALGAVYIQNSVCLLPSNPEHQRALRVLQKDVLDGGGEAFLLEAVGIDEWQESLLIQRFNADRDEEYVEFLGKCDDFATEIADETANEHFTYAELQENEEDLKKLKVWLEKIRKLDYCKAPKAEDAARRLAECEALLDEFAHAVFQRDTANLGGNDA